MTTTRPRPVVLAILDGWGHAPEGSHNAVTNAATPTLDMLFQTYPHGLINASELHVGLPGGQMGNSEVGHMNIGSGRVMMQDLPRIDQAIEDGSIPDMENFRQFIRQLKATGGACHLLGLVSDGGVHSHQAHLAYIANALAIGGVRVHIHAFLDGRDTPPKSAIGYITQLQNDTAGQTGISISTVSGRYYAMDRDNRWDRVKLAYDAIVGGAGIQAEHALSAVETSYAAGKTDEFVLPTAIGGYAGMKEGDGVMMINFRADRAREILQALLDPEFTGFERSKQVKVACALGMVEYSSQLSALLATLFPPEQLTHILGEVVSAAGLTQLRIAETEKYAHVTFFLNGGREDVFPGEERILIPSPDVATYDMKPEMSAYEVTDALEKAILDERFDLIVVNYANTDMVGHTGDINAATKAVEAVDSCLGRVFAALQKKGGAMIVTADHGNAEQMQDPHTHEPHTAHTLNLVPVILAVEALKGSPYAVPEGRLADITPTLLQLLKLPQPAEMTGCSLLPANMAACQHPPHA